MAPNQAPSVVPIALPTVLGDTLRNGRAGKRSSEHLKMDSNKLSTKNPQLEDISEQKTYSLELTDGLPRHGPFDWDRVTKD